MHLWVGRARCGGHEQERRACGKSAEDTPSSSARSATRIFTPEAEYQAPWLPYTHIYRVSVATQHLALLVEHDLRHSIARLTQNVSSAQASRPAADYGNSFCSNRTS